MKILILALVFAVGLVALSDALGQKEGIHFNIHAANVNNDTASKSALSECPCKNVYGATCMTRKVLNFIS